MALLNLKPRYVTLLWLSIAAMFLSCASLAAQETDVRKLQLNEQTIKAGLVYNFLKYTTWPQTGGAGNQIMICIFGHDPSGSYLHALQGQTVQQSVIKLVRKDRAADTADCNMVFVDSSQKSSLSSLLNFLGDKHVLTVSDMNQFARLGGMVELAMEDSRVALYVNEGAISKAGLSVQGRLLKLAKNVSR